MRKLMSAPFFAALLLCSAAGAKTKCESRPWPLGRTLSSVDVVRTVERMPRAEVLTMAWGEFLRNKQDSMALPILSYLASTEAHSTTRGYFQALNRMIYRNTDVRKSFREWPTRPVRAQAPLKLAQLCELYDKARK